MPVNYSQRSRFIYRNPLQDYLNAIKIRQDSKHFKSKLKYRKWAIEGIFAETKNLHCLSRARYRSVVKVQIQCHLIATVQNIKMLLKIILIKFYFFNRPSELIHLKTFLEILFLTKYTKMSFEN